MFPLLAWPCASDRFESRSTGIWRLNSHRAGACLFGWARREIGDREIDWRNVWLFGLPGITGAYFDAWAATYVSGVFQLTVFAVVMIVAAFLMLRPFDLQKKQ